MLTVRLKPCEIAVVCDELQHRRAVVVEAAAAAQVGDGTGSEGESGRDLETCHDELFLFTRVLDDLRTPTAPGQPREIVGPTWLLGPVIRGAAAEAAHRLLDAVKTFAEDKGRVTPDELRAKVDAASACAATLIGLDYAENNGVVT